MNSFFDYYFKTRDFAYTTLYSIIREGYKNRAVNTMQYASGRVVNSYNNYIEIIPMELREEFEPRSVSALISDEISLLMKVFDWYTKGKVSYRFSNSLTDLLAHTDVSDEVFQFDKLPYESFFLDYSDGKHTIIIEDNEFLLKGVFVGRVTNKTIEFAVCLSGIDEDPEPSHWCFESEPVAHIGFEIEDDSWSIGKLIDETLKRRLKEEDNKAEQHLVDARIQLAKEHHDIFKRISPLIFNSITYLLSDKPEIIHVPIPPSIQKRLNNIQSKDNKAIANLNLLRDAKFKFYDVGKSFDVGHEYIKGSGAEKSRHWRRGHWRNQRHGPKNELSKIIWMKPVIVRNDRKDDPITGKVISVD